MGGKIHDEQNIKLLPKNRISAPHTHVGARGKKGKARPHMCAFMYFLTVIFLFRIRF